MEQENNPIHEEISLDEIERRMDEAKAKINGHAWKQQGITITCTSCPFHHSFYVPPGTFLKGVDKQGNPILEEHFTVQ